MTLQVHGHTSSKKMDVSPDIIPTKIDLDSQNQLPRLIKIHTI